MTPYDQWLTFIKDVCKATNNIELIDSYLQKMIESNCDYYIGMRAKQNDEDTIYDLEKAKKSFAEDIENESNS